MRKTLGAFIATWMVICTAVPAAADLATPGLSAVKPYRLAVSTSSSIVTIEGRDFENQGHPDRDQYMHWQIRRDDSGWELCGRAGASGPHLCGGNTFGLGSETLQIGPFFTERPGFFELRVWRGLGEDGATDPAQGASEHSGWSNVIRIPVIGVFTTPPSIVSLSKKAFPLKGSPEAYDFVIDAKNVDATTVIIFRGDTVLHPGRIDGGHFVLTHVPDNYKLTTPGELSLSLRTDGGGESQPVWIHFSEPVVHTNSVNSRVFNAGIGQQGVPAPPKPPSAPVDGNAAVRKISSGIAAHTICETTVVHREPGGKPLVRDSGELTFKRGTEVTLAAKPTGSWAELVSGGKTLGYVLASCLSVP